MPPTQKPHYGTDNLQNGVNTAIYINEAINDNQLYHWGDVIHDLSQFNRPLGHIYILLRT